MDKNRSKKNKKAAPVKKPFLRGKPWDSLCVKSALGLMGGYAVLMLAFVLLGSLMLIEQTFLRSLMNGALLLAAYMIFFSFGASSGTLAVGQGEILHNRLETGRQLNKGQQDCCYHPLKGFLVALVGLIPFLIVAIVFACITTRQMTTMGGLPSWVSGLSGHPEVTDPLAAYSATVSMTAEDILRIFVRMNVMPWVNIFDSSNMDNMLTLEHVAPLLMLIPAISYGLGYTRGPGMRARVHGDIAMGRKKAAKKARRDHKRKVAAREPQQLN